MLTITLGTEKCDDVIIAKLVGKLLKLRHTFGLYELDELASFYEEAIKVWDLTPLISTLHTDYMNKLLLNNQCQATITGYLFDAFLNPPLLTDVAYKNKKSLRTTCISI